MISGSKSGVTAARLRARLERRGLRVTGQRLAVLLALSGARRALSHGELAERLDAEAMDRATVYRNLVALAEAGLLLRTLMPDGVWRYEVAEGSAPQHERHPHLVCVDCGEVRCLPRGAVELRGVEDEMVEIQLRGRCSSCLRTAG